MSTAETAPCPRCGETARIPVVYGYPGSDLGRAAEQGRLVLGGCVIGPESEIATEACAGCRSLITSPT